MKKILLLAASVLCALILPGCFQHHTTIRLNKDGSGTLVEETLLGAQMLGMLDQMAAGFGGGGAAPADPTKEMLSEEKAKKRATELGEGVSFEKAEPLNKDGSRGARVTYRFKDINQLKVSTGDGMKNLSPPGMPGAEAAAPKKQPPWHSSIRMECSPSACRHPTKRRRRPNPQVRIPGRWTWITRKPRP